MNHLRSVVRWLALAVATIAAAIATIAFTVAYGIAALLEVFGSMVALRWAESLKRDHREYPVYKHKLAELIERNKQFGAARNKSNGAPRSAGDSTP